MTDTMTPADAAQATTADAARIAKRRTRRGLARALLYVSLTIGALMVLAEPWLLVPLLIAAVAVSLWD